MRRGLLLVIPALLLSAAAAYPQTASESASGPPGAATYHPRLPDLQQQVSVPMLGAPPAVPRVVLAAQVTRPLVALTFDLDMNPGMAASARAGFRWINTDATSYLESTKIHATLFMTGMWAEVYPAEAHRLAANPNFEIGNHSYSHPAFHTPCYRLASVSRSGEIRQVVLAQQAIEQATGVTPKYFRFPGGCYDPAALDVVHAAGLIPVQWDVNSIDAFNAYPRQIAATVLAGVKPGSIVVMHLMRANAPFSAAALRIIIPELQRRGYEFVTVSELLAAGPAIQPTDPKETVEAAPTMTWPPQPPARRWCGWVTGTKGRVYVCR
jgi:peptidoglycan/xylan/chitin deacetylase (PgdA/CDA1 family)